MLSLNRRSLLKIGKVQWSDIILLKTSYELNKKQRKYPQRYGLVLWKTWISLHKTKPSIAYRVKVIKEILNKRDQLPQKNFRYQIFVIKKFFVNCMRVWRFGQGPSNKKRLEKCLGVFLAISFNKKASLKVIKWYKLWLFILQLRRSNDHAITIWRVIKIFLNGS